LKKTIEISDSGWLKIRYFENHSHNQLDNSSDQPILPSQKEVKELECRIMK